MDNTQAVETVEQQPVWEPKVGEYIKMTKAIHDSDGYRVPVGQWGRIKDIETEDDGTATYLIAWGGCGGGRFFCDRSYFERHPEYNN